MDCPLWGTTTSPGPVSASRINNDRGKSLGALYYLDDLVLDPALIPSIFLDQTHEDDVQHIFDLMLGPSLEERLAAAAEAVARGDFDCEGGAIDVQTLSSEQLRALARTAVRVQHTYDEFIASLARQEQGEAEWTMQGDVAAWIRTQPSDSDHDSLPDLVAWSRSPSPVQLSAPLLPPGIVVAVDGDDEAAASPPFTHPVLSITPEFPRYTLFAHNEQDIIDEAAALDFDIRATAAEAAYSRRPIYPGRPRPDESHNQNIDHVFSASPPPLTETSSVDFQRGGVITREFWSSSSLASTSESSFDNVEAYETPEQSVYYAPSKVPVALFTNRSSPAVTEWSVTTSDFAILPRAVIDAAVVKVIAQVPEREMMLETENFAETQSESAAALIIPTATTTLPFTPAFTLQNLALQQWIEANQRYQTESLRWEDDSAGGPFYSALHTLYGPLRQLLDIPVITANGLAHLDLLAATAHTAATYLLVHSIFVPRPTQSPTSLDYSLPDLRPPPLQLVAAPLLTSIPTDMENLNMPSAYVTHPLLTDLEAAKLHTLWNVLQRHRRYFLASLVLDILTFCFQDEYAVSQIFNSGVLQDRHPNTQYWELLPFEDDSEMGDDELQYPASEDGYPHSDGYWFETESSAIFTDSADMDSDSDAHPASMPARMMQKESSTFEELGIGFAVLMKRPQTVLPTAPRRARRALLTYTRSRSPSQQTGIFGLLWPMPVLGSWTSDARAVVLAAGIAPVDNPPCQNTVTSSFLTTTDLSAASTALGWFNPAPFLNSSIHNDATLAPPDSCVLNDAPLPITFVVGNHICRLLCAYRLRNEVLLLPTDFHVRYDAPLLLTHADGSGTPSHDANAIYDTYATHDPYDFALHLKYDADRDVLLLSVQFGLVIVIAIAFVELELVARTKNKP
ncbi:hypothetical protein B0H17DRAFT_1274599 [Mycena rosella]|uniref:Uncharacterized protein n=1 Tax=Mycena rosella TaxID=1033263 RepID=A0AAD7FXB6_MYCRO|nr:hypothetical protein B0H17DRAFT_1274599 [Mycena rosella]